MMIIAEVKYIAESIVRVYNIKKNSIKGIRNMKLARYEEATKEVSSEKGKELDMKTSIAETTKEERIALNLQLSEIGLGAEWLERRSREEVAKVVHCCEGF